MEDGIDSMDVSTVSADHAVGIEPLVAQQLEIFRGPTSLLYGSGAVGGVVNTVTNRIPTMAPEGGFEGEFELRNDTVSDGRTGAVTLDGGGDSFAWHVDGARRKTDNYAIPGFAELEPDDDEVPGLLENSDMENASFAAGASWLGDNSFFGASVSTFDTNYGIPGHHEEEDHDDHDDDDHDDHDEEGHAVRIDLKQTRIDLKGGWSEVSTGIEEINFRMGINDYEHVEIEGDEIATRFENDAYEGRLEFLHSPLGEWEGAFGTQFAHREFSSVGAEAFIPPVNTTSYGVFLVEQRDLGPWQFSTGARLEFQEIEQINSGLGVDDSAKNLSLAALRDIGEGFAFSINFAVAERLPVAEELYSNGPHLATGTVEIGNSSLGKETSTHFDIGIRKTLGTLTWSVAGFRTSYDNFIYLQNSGKEDSEHELPIFNYSQRGADLFGYEAEIFTPIASLGVGEVDMRLFADYVEGELSSGGYLPRLPPLRLGGRVQYHDDSITIGLEATQYADQENFAAYETTTKGYTMVNADFSRSFVLAGGTEFDVFFRGSNLSDEEARKHTSFVKADTPLPGRNYTFGLRTRF
jgi:iron complex outermembrane receptor protein